MRFRTMMIFSVAAAGFWVTLPASAGTVTVNAADNIYGAGQGLAPGGGNVPGFIALGSGIVSVSFSSVTGSITCTTSNEGCITVNGGRNNNDADGAGSETATSSNTGAGSISGITAPGAGYLVGLFVASGGPSGTAPAPLDYTSTSSESSSSYSPLLDQTFFIGDGLTGDGTGSQQVFNVPTGAADLYLGISDASFYNGTPGAYGDNSGNYTVTYALAANQVSGTPEPGSLALLGLGLLSFRLMRRYRKG